MEEQRQSPSNPPDTPRWVKLLFLAAAVVITVVIVAMLLLGGEHGPARHM